MRIGSLTAGALAALVIVVGGFGYRAVQQGPVAHASLDYPPQMHMTIGSVVPEAPGVAPWVTNTGTQADPILNFGLTTGATGATGSTGATGATGPAGAPGTVVQGLRATTISAGTYTWTYPVAYAGGVVPIVTCTAETPAATTYIVNCQLDGPPTNTQAKFRVNRSDITVVALLGLTILSIPASPGAITIHITAQAP